MNILGGFLILVAGGWGGVIYFAINGIPFWLTLLILNIYGTFLILAIFHATDWLMTQWARFHFSNNVSNFKNRITNISPSTHARNWLIKRKSWIVLALNFVPFVPVLPLATTAAARIMKIKYALPILILGNFARSLALCLMVYYKIAPPGA